jgi:3-phosphoshikimate 1-carboxyvinyltransferase
MITSLPDLIEIVPLPGPVAAEIAVPGSKSITNRALVLAALGNGVTTLRDALWSEDTRVMIECLQTLGYNVRVEPDSSEPSNRTIRVEGRGGRVPAGGSVEKPVDLFVGNAGTAARFLTAMVCLGSGVYRLHGTRRMHERPQGALFDAVRELGYCIDSVNNHLPALVHGGGPRKADCCVSISESSQFASALMLCSSVAGWNVHVVGENAEESPYVAMTTELVRTFPRGGGEMKIEPDASSGSYFWAAGWLLAGGGNASELPVQVRHWPETGWQIDAEFPKFLPLRGTISRQHHLGDSIMTAIVSAPFATGRVRFTELGRLRVQECERVAALKAELTRCGAKVKESEDTLEIEPSKLHGAEIETYNDHRMAMCFATLGLKVPGIKIKNPSCVNKTFPDFFQKLALPPPQGLGAVLLHGRTGARLKAGELMAG